MLQWIFTLLVLYLIYKLVFDFILPVSKASGQVKSKLKEMHQTQNRNAQQAAAKQPEKSSATNEGDYIDFEEIK